MATLAPPLVRTGVPTECGHPDDRGFMEYQNVAETGWRRLRRKSRTYRYCMTCHMAFRRIFDAYWAHQIDLAEVAVQLRAMNIHEHEREIRKVIRELRRTNAPERS